LVAWWVAFLGELGASYVFLHGPPVAAHMAICAAVLAIAVVVYMTQLQVRRQAELDAAGA